MVMVQGAYTTPTPTLPIRSYNWHLLWPTPQAASIKIYSLTTEIHGNWGLYLIHHYDPTPPCSVVHNVLHTVGAK